MTQAKSPRFTLHALALAALVATTAQAQNTPAKADDKKAETPTETVVVTSNRRSEDQQKVSSVVQSITADQLRRDGVQDLRTLPAVVPGLSVANQEGNLEIYIRGVGTGNNTELGDPSAAPHINGVYIPRPRGLGSMFFDLERVEINKGPQGTLYGRNAMAGALNIVTAQPKLGRFEGYAQAEVANRKGAGAEVAVNVPIGDDLAIRGALQWVKRDAGFKNTNTDALARDIKPAGLEDNVAGRLSVLWAPTDRLRVNVMFDAGKETGTGYPGANTWPAASKGIDVNTLDLRQVRYRGPQGEMDNEVYGLQTKLTYDFDSIGTEFTLSRRSVDFYQRNASSDGVNYPGFTSNSDNYSTVFWQTVSDSDVAELRLYSTKPSAALKWTAGAFAFREKQKSAFFALNDPGFFYSGTEFTMPDVRAKSSALYADANYKLSESTRVLGGVRTTSEDKSRWGIGGNYAFGAGALNTANGNAFDCCVGARLGTPGFVPALLDRRNFTLPVFTNNQQRAQAFLDAIKVSGVNDTVVRQITPIANGSNPNGACVINPTIVSSPTLVCRPESNGGYSWVSLDGVNIIQQVGKSSASYTDFRIGLEHDLNRDQMVYAKYSTGHKAGGFNDTLSDGKSPIYLPEQVRVLEFGTRNAFGQGADRVVANLTGFYYDYNDYVLQSLTCTGVNAAGCAGYALLNENAAKAKIKGLEGELRMRLVGNLRLDLSGVLLDAKIKKATVADGRAPNFGGGLPAALIDVSGNTLPQASKFSFTARLQHRVALGSGSFDWQVVASYRSKYYLDHFNDDDVRFAKPDGTTQVLSAKAAGYASQQKGYTTVNLGAGYEFGNGMRLEGWVTNATNEQASQKRILGGSFDVRFLNEARTFGLRARYAF
jgi:iron complex outermembrane recepter protein